jgi:hypothetical protein
VITLSVITNGKAEAEAGHRLRVAAALVVVRLAVLVAMEPLQLFLVHQPIMLVAAVDTVKTI